MTCLQLLLSLCVFSPPSLPFPRVYLPSPASDLARQCVIYWICKREMAGEERRGGAVGVDGNVRSALEESPLTVSLSCWMWCSNENHRPDEFGWKCLTPVNPGRLGVAAGFKQTVAQSPPPDKNAIIIRQLLCSVTLSCFFGECSLHISYHQRFCQFACKY